MTGGTWVAAIDVGGTFTDAVAIRDDGETRVAKVASTPADPAGGLIEALRELSASGVDLGRIKLLFHGTTVHGMQSRDPAHHGDPLTYYHKSGPFGQAFAALPIATSATGITISHCP